jgi:hypothetical protein
MYLTVTPSSQEVTTDRYVDIPEAVQEIYRIWRPSPLFRAHNLEKALGTTCRIYYKYADTLNRGTRVAFHVRLCSGTKVAVQRAPTSRTPLCRRYVEIAALGFNSELFTRTANASDNLM